MQIEGTKETKEMEIIEKQFTIVVYPSLLVRLEFKWNIVIFNTNQDDN